MAQQNNSRITNEDLKSFLESCSGHVFVRRTCLSKTLLTLSDEAIERLCNPQIVRSFTSVVPTLKNPSIEERLFNVQRFTEDQEKKDRAPLFATHRNQWITALNDLQPIFRQNNVKLNILEYEGNFTYNMYADDSRVLTSPLWDTAWAVDSPHSTHDRKETWDFFQREIAFHMQASPPVVI